MDREALMAQVRLLVRALPGVAEEAVFALKGGTAINLFYRDMPRFSVDIDLTYLPVMSREESLVGIDDALLRIRTRLEEQIRGARVTASRHGDDKRLEVRVGRAGIKIETSPVIRGTVHPVRAMRVSQPVEAQFALAEMKVVAFEDLYAGKLVAALDRQHPRDLFDVSILLATEGLTDELFRTFLVYVASSRRPIHELLSPVRLDISKTYNGEFKGMTTSDVSLPELLEVRERLIGEVRTRLDGAARDFLLGLHDGSPDFSLVGLPAAQGLPAVRWKVINLIKLRSTDPVKHAWQREAIEDAARGRKDWGG